MSWRREGVGQKRQVRVHRGRHRVVHRHPDRGHGKGAVELADADL
jgi:hypothetical protein